MTSLSAMMPVINQKIDIIYIDIYYTYKKQTILKMKFCIQCSNMYYVSILEGGDKLVYYCRHCGHIDEFANEEGTCVLKTQLKKGAQTFNHIINKYTKLDPTLPRIYNIKCPNETCKTNHEDNKTPAEVIYMRYDDENMKYLYICAECDTVWKTDDANV